MRKKLLNYKTVPRWVILLIDLIIISWSFALSYFILKQFEFKEIYRGHFFLYTGTYCLISFTVFYLMRIHTGLIRYSNMQDVLRIFSAVLISSLIYPVLVELIIASNFSIQWLDLGKVLLINFFISSSLLIMLRTAVKESFHYVRRITPSNVEKALIFGSDSNAVLIKQALESSNDTLLIAGFVDTNRHKVNSYIEQKKVFHIKDLQLLKNKYDVNKLILLNEYLGSVEKKLVINECLALGIRVVTVPPSVQWVHGKLSLKQIADLKIEDLLQREPIVINNHLISNELKDKRILITGAAGSIGSEIVRQVLNFDPQLVILCDQAESALHEMQLEVEEKFPDANVKVFIGSIQNLRRMQLLFKEYQPQIIFHAAAYKHVPMMENNPSEAILTNVAGSKNMADLAVKFGVDKFVMISTDKAVKPTNVMGASKRIAEIYIQSLNNSKDDILDILASNYKEEESWMVNNKTKFITTRFGNVLDSNGSVIPRFRAQIQKGGPVTVTDPEITRYFMTIPEAVQLVLEAGTMGKGGEVFVFDMGKPVRIANLANQMIKLAGLVPDKDIKIIYTGLRPGEKLYEELLNEKEATLPTHHEKIKIAKVIAHKYGQVSHDIEELILMANHEVNDIIVSKMKDMVPDYISNNSHFEKLDQLKFNKDISQAENAFNIVNN